MRCYGVATRGIVLGDRGDVCDARAFSDIACRDRLINLAGSHYVLKRIYSVTQVWLTEESGMVVSVALNEHCCETQPTCGVNAIARSGQFFSYTRKTTVNLKSLQNNVT